MLIPGIGPNEPVVENKEGGQQSKVHYRMDLMPSLALLGIAQRLDYGIERGYVEDNWRKIPAKEHLNKALIHIAAFQAGDTQDNHARAAACRIMMWLEQIEQERMK